MFLKELNNNDFFIMQQKGRCGKLYYSIRSNFDMQILEKKFFKTLFEAKIFFRDKLPNKICYYDRLNTREIKTLKILDIEYYNHKVREYVLAKAKEQQEDKRRKIEINNNDVSDVSCKRKNKVCVFDGKKYIDIEVNLKDIIK